MKAMHLGKWRETACGLVGTTHAITGEVRKVDCYNCRRTKIYSATAAQQQHAELFRKKAEEAGDEKKPSTNLFGDIYG